MGDRGAVVRRATEKKLGSGDSNAASKVVPAAANAAGAAGVAGVNSASLSAFWGHVFHISLVLLAFFFFDVAIYSRRCWT
jgi:hypothetical protein